MADPYLFLCGDARLSVRSRLWREARTRQLQLGTGRNRIHLKIHHLTRKVAKRLPAEAIDLLEIAAYVYVADQLISRGGQKEFEYGQKWHRHFRFEIPVRRPELWSDSAICQTLQDALGFLSDDRYEFGFTRVKNPQPMEQYLFDFADQEEDGFEEVMLFSGGLDSFGGAVQEILQSQRRVVLVSHRPVSKIYARQCNLVAAMLERLVDRNRRPLHVAVEVNKSKNMGPETTQRVRSFLFAAMAAVVARAFDRNRIRFYENGVVSLNFPISPQVLGGRATRTTHPRVLEDFQRIFSKLFDVPFTVENPFLWKTKAEIIEGIRAAGSALSCAQTGSCVHTKSQTLQHSHCGSCSQCVDRRLTALAAHCTDQEDPRGMYASDVIVGEREGADLTLVERYVGTVLQVRHMQNPLEFQADFPQAADVYPYLPISGDDAARNIFDLYHRHASQVSQMLFQLVRDESELIVQQSYPANSLLGVAIGRAGEGASATTSRERHRSVPVNERPVADRDTFTIRFQGEECFLGNTLEFGLFERLNQRPGHYVSIRALAEDVWRNDDVEKNTIQKTVGNLRRKIREKLPALAIEGTRDAYVLRIPASICSDSA